MIGSQFTQGLVGYRFENASTQRSNIGSLSVLIRLGKCCKIAGSKFFNIITGFSMLNIDLRIQKEKQIVSLFIRFRGWGHCRCIITCHFDTSHPYLILYTIGGCSVKSMFNERCTWFQPTFIITTHWVRSNNKGAFL